MASTTSATTPSRETTAAFASFYVLSGICQPLLMTVATAAGLANSRAQLYMFFYYLGPSLLMVTVPSFCCYCCGGGDQYHHHPKQQQQQQHHTSATTTTRTTTSARNLPSSQAIMRAGLVAMFDIVAQALNYTGAGLAGSSIFAVIYSSVTVWTALFSRIFLGRTLSCGQWMAILLVFGGLSITAANSMQIGADVRDGAVLIGFGSAVHGATYVMSEAIMKNGGPESRLSVRENAGIQGLVACLALGSWQIFYTWPRWDNLIVTPTQQAGTSWLSAWFILLAFTLANLVHSFSYFHTLSHYPGGATSAGIMKGLQAVLVFLATHVLFCGRVGGPEMCFSWLKLLSLVTVVGGVAWFAQLVQQQQEQGGTRHPPSEGYRPLPTIVDDDLQSTQSSSSTSAAGQLIAVQIV